MGDLREANPGALGTSEVVVLQPEGAVGREGVEEGVVDGGEGGGFAEVVAD
jgi:hypothetical protein